MKKHVTSFRYGQTVFRIGDKVLLPPFFEDGQLPLPAQPAELIDLYEDGTFGYCLLEIPPGEDGLGESGIDGQLKLLESSEPPTLRPFTKSDWDAFAGCESKNPEIAYVDTGEPGAGARADSAVIVLDGNTVQVLFDTEDVLSHEFKTPALARLVAERLVASQDPAADEVVKLWDEAEAFGLTLL